MKIPQPFSSYYPITQHFGENLATYYIAGGFLGHSGIDFAMPTGTPIISPVNGIVSGLSLDIQKGEGVSIMSDDIFQWNGQDCKLICIHWHLKDKSIVVKVGDKVKVSDLLGLSNNTGQSTGPHLHFGILPVTTDGLRKSLAGLGNGYGGYVDPMPYLELELPPVVKPVLKIGSIGDAVKELQTKLGGLVVDGKFGNLTKKAVIAYQLNHFLFPDGIVGAKTWAKLN